ncbi:MAG: hypothetical protein M3Z66_08760 [Chloroflexota bacterium]|nr:hypothetical protein [Chloroflexota bacterium]
MTGSSGAIQQVLAGGSGYSNLILSDTGYFEVMQGDLLGYGGKTLYVPFSGVDRIMPGERLTVNYAGVACEERDGGARWRCIVPSGLRRTGGRLAGIMPYPR